MAKYRQLYTEFWSDGFVIDLTPEEKYFYLYIMTNSKTSQCGIYEIPKQIMVTETGYNRETVDKLLNRFSEYKKIAYCDETKELMIMNWIKYNSPNNVNAVKCVNKELNKVKNHKFIELLYNQCEMYDLNLEKIFEGLNIDLQGAYKELPSNRIISNKEEISNKKEKVISNKGIIPANDDFKNLVKVFEDNIHPITTLEYEKLLDWTNDVSSEVIIMAIEEAVNYNARTMKYVAKVLSSWISKGIKTVEEVMLYQRDWQDKKNSSSNDKGKKGTFCDYEQRQYRFDELERKLLGIDKSEE